MGRLLKTRFYCEMRKHLRNLKLRFRYWKCTNKLNLPDFPKELTENIVSSLDFKKGDNRRYFKYVKEFNFAHLALPYDPGLYLYAPNYCVIDFLQSLPNKNKTIADIASGLGFLSVYLKYLGYQTYNYDTFGQIRESTIKSFMDKIGTTLITDKNKLIDLKPNVVSFICLPYDGLDLDFMEKLIEGAEYFLIDNYFNESFSKFKYPYKLIKTYPGLLSVYKIL